MRISTSVWWPRVSKEMESFVKSCPVCQKTTTPNKEPLISTLLPSHPWERIASDLFELKNSTYLLTVRRSAETEFNNIIQCHHTFKIYFGIPAEMVSDNGPQFSSQEMKEFSEKYGFRHITTGPHYPQPNERTIKTVKSLLENAPDHYKVLLSYRATPMPWCSLMQSCRIVDGDKKDIPQVKATELEHYHHCQSG